MATEKELSDRYWDLLREKDHAEKLDDDEYIDSVIGELHYLKDNWGTIKQEATGTPTTVTTAAERAERDIEAAMRDTKKKQHEEAEKKRQTRYRIATGSAAIPALYVSLGGGITTLKWIFTGGLTGMPLFFTVPTFALLLIAGLALTILGTIASGVAAVYTISPDTVIGES